jgi:tetratricopeptide (TPR) repeat protein
MNRSVGFCKAKRITFLVITLLMHMLVASGAGADPSYELKQASPFSESVAADKETVACLKKGHEALDKNDLDEATKVFRSCVEQHPKSGLAHYWLGQAYQYGFKMDEAIVETKEALRLEPGNLYGLHALGRLYSLDKNKLDVAEELLTKVAGIDPHFDEARFDLARVYARKGEMDKAFQLFSQLFSQEMRFAVYHAELGKILTASGQERSAMDHYNRALTLQPDYEPAKKLIQELQNKRQTKGDEKEAPPADR